MSRPLALLLNANSRADLTVHMVGLAKRLSGGALRWEGMTNAAAPGFVATRNEARAAGQAARQALAQRFARSDLPRPDAVLLASFGEPGLWDLRAALPVPVTGMLEASVATALQLGRRFAILTPGRDWPDQLAELLARYGVAGRCASVSALPDAAMAEDPALWRPAIAAAVAEAAQGAEVVVLGGGWLAGRGLGLAAPEGVRLVDAFAAAVAQTRALAGLAAPPPGD